MKDEYGSMTSEGDTYTCESVVLECGLTLRKPQVRYRTFGHLNEKRDNCLVVCHALTGNAALDSWWGEMLGPGKLFDSRKYMVVCLNVLGSCYGTTGPTSVNPDTNQPYGASFPPVTIRDSVGLHIRAVKEGIKATAVVAVVGGSLGGMQALEWALLAGPKFVKTVMAMCCGAMHTPWQIGISETQRQAIFADPKWRGGRYPVNDPPVAGLSVARQIAMITYRSHEAYMAKFGRRQEEREFEVERYLHHQGAKFPQRFDALSYVTLTRLMDTHDVGRGRGGSVQAALASLVQPVLVLSVSSDMLYPPHEQEALAQMLPNAEYHVIVSDAGHDGFLLEQEAVAMYGKRFLERHDRVVKVAASSRLSSSRL
jgi:homoserine O-acetyltransferase